MNNEAIRQLIVRHPNHYIHKGEVDGMPVAMFYTIYPGDDPSAPYPYVEDSFVVTMDGEEIQCDVKPLEDAIFAAHTKRGKVVRALG